MVDGEWTHPTGEIHHMLNKTFVAAVAALGLGMTVGTAHAGATLDAAADGWAAGILTFMAAAGAVTTGQRFLTTLGVGQ